jgi:hypothetical protein
LDKARGCCFNFGPEILKQIKFVEANFYGETEAQEFDSFVPSRLFVVAKKLVDFRVVIKPE